MDVSNIVSTPTIHGIENFQYLGVIFSGPYKGPNGYSALLNDVVRQANKLGADWVISFHVQTTPSFIRTGREFSGFGTPIKVLQRG